eukprot:GHUV01054262.1.p2 GENE.GHUV01054262.1~~GHUV01054262.1.p2  ORF type:complete len:102 (-),score=21.22 GHUV01054262.1:2-307(-)
MYDAWCFLPCREAVQQLETPAAPGASFPALLGPLTFLGALSNRQVYKATYKAETDRWGGRMPLFGPATVTAKAAMAAVELSDFHRQLAGERHFSLSALKFI